MKQVYGVFRSSGIRTTLLFIVDTLEEAYGYAALARDQLQQASQIPDPGGISGEAVSDWKEQVQNICDIDPWVDVRHEGAILYYIERIISRSHG